MSWSSRGGLADLEQRKQRCCEYDGQFAYYIARDPVGARSYLGANPSYRYQRILYPMLARCLALGQPALIPWTLLLINVVSISLGTELLGRMLKRHGLSPYLVLLLPFWLGQVSALRADLNEPLSFFCAIVALWLYERNRYMLSALAITASGLAKEMGLLFLPAILLVTLLRRRWGVALRYSLVVILPFALLQCFLSAWIGRSGLYRITDRFEGVPFYGFMFTQPLAARVFLVLIVVLPAAALLVLAVLQLRQDHRSLYAWSLVMNCLIIIFLPRLTAVDVLAVFRVATGVVIAALLFCAVHRLRRWALVLCGIWLPPSVLVFMIPGFM
jgi:hypothetical protein